MWSIEEAHRHFLRMSLQSKKMKVRFRDPASRSLPRSPTSETTYTDASSARWINDFAIPTL